MSQRLHPPLVSDLFFYLPSVCAEQRFFLAEEDGGVNPIPDFDLRLPPPSLKIYLTKHIPATSSFHRALQRFKPDLVVFLLFPTRGSPPMIGES